MNLDLTKLVILFLSLGAIAQDLISRKVSNRSVRISALILISVIVWNGGFSNLLIGLGGSLVCFGLGFILWRFGVLGAGDVKVMAVIALSLPWARSVELLFYSLVWGSVLGVVALLLDKTLFQESRVLNFNPMMTIRSNRVKGHAIPFTVGIFFGILTVWLLDSKGVYFL